MEIIMGKSAPVNAHIQECDAYRLNISLHSVASPNFMPPPPSQNKEKNFR